MAKSTSFFFIFWSRLFFARPHSQCIPFDYTTFFFHFWFCYCVWALSSFLLFLDFLLGFLWKLDLWQERDLVREWDLVEDLDRWWDRDLLRLCPEHGLWRPSLLWLDPLLSHEWLLGGESLILRTVLLGPCILSTWCRTVIELLQGSNRHSSF